MSDMNVTAGRALDRLDRIVIAYILLPLPIFLLGWLKLWVALPLVACLLYAARSLFKSAASAQTSPGLTRWQLSSAVLIAVVWTLLGGTGHFFFTNGDWHIRDAVLHDLVTSPWPVGYGALDGHATVLRTAIGFFMPAALFGKLTGLLAAHLAMMCWTALGATLFLLQVSTLLPARRAIVIIGLLVVVLFSGMDMLGGLLNGGMRFLKYWNIANHLEWWAVSYQYSSITTQLFWVPNHALAAWLTMGLLCRHPQRSGIDVLLPIILVGSMLWSPLSAVGLVPFIALKVVANLRQDRNWALLHPRVWLAALPVGVVAAMYLIADPDNIPKGLSSQHGLGSMSHQFQFFLIEAGMVGGAILLIQRRLDVVLALIVLFFLPFAWLGPGNDLVMRASIPSLALLAIVAAKALLEPTSGRRGAKVLLTIVLLIGAITPVQEIARALIVPAWPINRNATLIGANCGQYPPHYVARLNGQFVDSLLRPVHPLDQGFQFCENPALFLMNERHILMDVWAFPQ